MDIKQVALNDEHVRLGAKMVPFAGYNMPLRYNSEMEEHKTVRSGVGIFDVSHMGEFMVNGPRALDLLQKVTSNDVSRLADGQAQYSCLTNAQGGIVDDLLIYRFNEEKYMLVVNAANIEKDWNWIRDHNDSEAEMKNVSDDISLLAVQGPLAGEVLQRITPVELDQIKYYRFATGDIGGAVDVIISATGYTGSGGFELYVSNEQAVKLWHAIMDAGASANIKPIGLGARDTLRLEMGFNLYGNDISDETSTLEAGLGWITKFNKSFIGKEVLGVQKQEGVQRKLIGFEMIDKGIPRNGYEIFNEKHEVIGFVTSGSLSPSLGVGIGLGYVKTSYSQPESKLLVRVRNKYLTAEVVKLPFYRKG
ncbi:MAG: glycine cleavage system aminomethyltransferase GcvT [Candidatus Cyclobacteriaceae bacterium M3_2C_046]